MREISDGFSEGFRIRKNVSMSQSWAAAHENDLRVYFKVIFEVKQRGTDFFYLNLQQDHPKSGPIGW